MTEFDLSNSRKIILVKGPPAPRSFSDPLTHQVNYVPISQNAESELGHQTEVNV